MSAGDDKPRPWRALARWTACFTLVLGLHAAGAMALFLPWSAAPAAVASAPVILVELAPVPMAPTIKPTMLPQGPQQLQVRGQPAPTPPKSQDEVAVKPSPKKLAKKPVAKPIERPAKQTVTAEPVPVKEVELSAWPPPRPVERPTERPKRHQTLRHHPSLASAPSTAEQRAWYVAAPSPGASTRNSHAVPNWKSALVARLERYKRYPEVAQARGDHGMAELAFSVDRRGGVHHARIVHSSGSALLDRATLELVERAQPLPPPPPEIPGIRIPIEVPIRYSIR